MIGIDVGGANLKVADGKGIHLHYCPLWEGAPLGTILLRYAGDEAAVVMSGEEADSFATKQRGIEYIVQEVRQVFPNARFYGIDGKFHNNPVLELSAANWLASADLLREEYPDAVLVDMGSTTTDITPLALFEELRGTSDLVRLQEGYLVYTGLLRTPVPALIGSAEVGGKKTLLASERFAVTADVHLALGNITDAIYTIPTPDGGAKTVEGALRRLARHVCADLEEIGTAAVASIAEQAWEAQKALIEENVARAVLRSGASELIFAGIGSGLLSRTFGGTDLARVLGPASDALCAHAVRGLCLRTAGS
ncbi:MAG: hydantoinase/oxoprolinase family protein [Methanomicrobiaceae archaeon]|nr:hydantoinase/oxoprolinase family protein [Methanomicrobiaceae archaeon]